MKRKFNKEVIEIIVQLRIEKTQISKMVEIEMI